nr:hypothetical protein [Tanacetum cinerariifolium]
MAWMGWNADIKDGVTFLVCEDALLGAPFYFPIEAEPSIVGEPLSPDHVFDFPVDEPEPHPTYDFFMPRPLTGYAGNPNNNNGRIEADVPLLGELGAVADKLMVGPLDDEIAKPIVEAKEQDDDSEGFDEDEVWEVNEEWLMALVTPSLMPVVPPPSIYKVGGPSTTAEGQSSSSQHLDFLEIGPRISAVEGQEEMERDIIWFSELMAVEVVCEDGFRIGVDGFDDGIKIFQLKVSGLELIDVQHEKKES